jgi:hypothetical protein
VILDVDGEISLPGLERNALRDRPAREGAVTLQPEVVVQPARIVALDDEDRLFPTLAAPERLGGLLPVSLAFVLAELRHAPSMPSAGPF